MGAHISQYGGDGITISGVSGEDLELLQGVARGTQWLCIQDGVPQFRSVLEKLPDPVKDSEMLPFWKEHHRKVEQAEFSDLVFDELHSSVIYSAHITISGLCGYYYTKEGYAREASKLQSYGFFQMRSPRGDDGKYWELWYLPGLWAARGNLKDIVATRSSCGSSGKRKDRATLRTVLEFLRKNVSFGSLDVSVQRMAMVLED